jgi:hypothetical protein
VLQRCHWRLYVIGVEPLQVPVVDVAVCPCCAVPLIVGSVTFLGLCDPLAAEAPPAATMTATIAAVAAGAMRRLIKIPFVGEQLVERSWYRRFLKL